MLRVEIKCVLFEFIFVLSPLQPPQFKLDPRLARMLGIHTQTRPVIIQALWQYVKTHKLQDPHEREFINCDKYLQQVRMRNGENLEMNQIFLCMCVLEVLVICMAVYIVCISLNGLLISKAAVNFMPPFFFTFKVLNKA